MGRAVGLRSSTPAKILRPVARGARRRPAGTALAVLVFSALGVGVAAAQGFGQIPGEAAASRFKAAPVAASVQEAEAGDLILGMVPADTLFFITAAVIAVFWFTVGGGRKPRIGRSSH